MSILAAAVILTLVMDPLGNAPVFKAVIGNVAAERRVRIIVREMLIALLILALFLFFGRTLLTAMQLTPPALSIAGGVVLFLVAIRMIFPGPGGLNIMGDDGEPFIVPLAMPMIAGPATITLVVLFTTREPDRLMDWLAALLIAWAVSAVVLLVADYVLGRIGESGQRALTRLMGMILTAIAVQMLLNGIGEFLTSLPGVVQGGKA
ncbi:MAG TPA: MarC family protein [Rhodospirillales bacterium]|jgi:multiple antibiotic resistance protein